jgi:hypothetical protein
VELLESTIYKMNLKKNTRKTGDIGEALACQFLVDRGFTVVEKNYSKKWEK